MSTILQPAQVLGPNPISIVEDGPLLRNTIATWPVSARARVHREPASGVLVMDFYLELVRRPATPTIYKPGADRPAGFPIVDAPPLTRSIDRARPIWITSRDPLLVMLVRALEAQLS